MGKGYWTWFWVTELQCALHFRLRKGNLPYRFRARKFDFSAYCGAYRPFPSSIYVNHIGKEIMTTPNVKQAVPFFGVRDIQASLRFYLDGLGFTKTNEWTPEGKLRWCWLEHGEASLMLQEFWGGNDQHPANVPQEKLGVGVSICFICEDALALYHEFKARGVAASQPFVGNGMWVISVTDPDGNRLDF